MMTTIYNNIIDILRLTSGWDELTGYQRARLFCESAHAQGEALPKWQIIRDYIGHGSSRDIQRARNDVVSEERKNQARMHALNIQGVPDDLAPHILALWVSAKELAHSEYQKSVYELQSISMESQNAKAKAEAERNDISKLNRELDARCTGLLEANKALTGQVETERAGREQAIQMVEASRRDLQGQRDELLEELKRSRKEVDAAIQRLEDVENHAQMQIETARQEARAKIEILEEKLRGKTAEHKIEVHRMDEQLMDWKNRCNVAEQETRKLRESLNAPVSHEKRKLFPKRGHKT
ncbi:MAG: hypothetical protein HKM02_08650 [Pseudomonadales bacterium]|nr:hypothetical protein [Pseudomonadales bacterium]